MFDRQWQTLRAYAAARGVQLIGDIPIFVAHDSADVWAHQASFQLDARGRPTSVSGVPPDYFSEDGQLWGTPLYRWRALKRDRYAFWIERFRALLDRFDLVRLDHFIGFVRYWQIPTGAETARLGRWQRGPGRDLFEVARKKLGALPFIAEDLGEMSAEVEALRDELGFPGMRVLQFGFGSDAHNQFLPHHFVRNCVAYTGTHDNNTLLGWLKDVASASELHRVREYVGQEHEPSAEALSMQLMRLLLSSVAQLAVVPMQDVLCLDDRARMNVPGRAEDNWSFRLPRGALSKQTAKHLLQMTRTYGRAGQWKEDTE
jgi:4-alpha-glucanotransferase